MAYSDGVGDSVGEGDGDGEDDEDDSSDFFSSGEAVGDGDAFFLLGDDDVEALVPVFLVVEVVPVVFFVVAAVDDAEVVDVVSCCLHAVMKAAATIAVINPRTNFFIVKVVVPRR